MNRAIVCWKLDGIYASVAFGAREAADAFARRLQARGAKDVYVYG